MLPESILKEAQEELLNWHGLGMSVLEVGHRTLEFTELLARAEQTLRDLLHIPNSYHVLFLGMASRTQFAMIPMNFLNPDQEAGYIVTGLWSQMAFQEAQLLKKAYCIRSEEQGGFISVPEDKVILAQENTGYVYYTPNETVHGVKFPYTPKVKNAPLIADMTSCLLSEPLDIQKYGLIFSGAQKNIANAGLTIVIVRNDLLERAPNPVIPTMLHYKTQAQHHSLYATPPVFNIYLASKMFDWLKSQGGIESVFTQNCMKAAKIYQYLDSSDFYTTKVRPEARSIMNVCFSLQDSSLEEKFILCAEQRGLCALKGHRLVGGLRASLYNAMPIDGVELLVQFMTEFAQAHQVAAI